MGTENEKFGNADEALEAVGTFGRYQIYVCVIMQYSAIIGAGTFALANFGQLFPTYHCENIHLKREDYISTHSVSFECGVLHNCTNLTLINRYFKSMTDEWFLVCERAPFIRIILIASACGRILGAIIGGHIGDYFGRKTVLYPSQYGICIVSALSTACTQWYNFAICEFLVGFCYGVGETSVFVLAMEITSSKHRWIPNCCMQWCLQYPIVALIAYLTGNWRMYLIIINVIFAPLLVFFMIFMESPRYLIYQEQFDRSAKTLNDMASNRWNSVRLKHEIESVHFSEIPTRTKTAPEDPKHPSPLELFRTFDRAKLTVTLMVAMFFRSVVSNIFITDASDESGNPFVNIALYGITPIWVPFFVVFMDRKVKKFGRRLCFLLFSSSLVIVLLIIVIMSLSGKLNPVSLRILGLIGASLGASGSYMSITQIVIEAYPTAIRGMAYGWVGCFDGVGSLLAPDIMRLAHIWLELPPMIMFVLAVVSIVGGYMVLPETKHEILKDKLNQFQFKRKRSEA